MVRWSAKPAEGSATLVAEAEPPELRPPKTWYNKLYTHGKKQRSSGKKNKEEEQGGKSTREAGSGGGSAAWEEGEEGAAWKEAGWVLPYRRHALALQEAVAFCTGGACQRQLRTMSLIDEVGFEIRVSYLVGDSALLSPSGNHVGDNKRIMTFTM